MSLNQYLEKEAIMEVIQKGVKPPYLGHLGEAETFLLGMFVLLTTNEVGITPDMFQAKHKIYM